MKFRRFFAVLLALCLMAALAGCKKDNVEQEGAPEKQGLAALSDEELMPRLLSGKEADSKNPALDAEYKLSVKTEAEGETSEVTLDGTVLYANKEAALNLNLSADGETEAIGFVYKNGTVYLTAEGEKIRFPMTSEDLAQMFAAVGSLPSEGDIGTLPELPKDLDLNPDSFDAEKIFRTLALIRNDDGTFTVKGTGLSEEAEKAFEALYQQALEQAAEELPEDAMPEFSVSDPELTLTFSADGNLKKVSFSAAVEVNVAEAFAEEDAEELSMKLTFSFDFEIRSTDASQVTVSAPADADQYTEIPNPLISILTAFLQQENSTL